MKKIVTALGNAKNVGLRYETFQKDCGGLILTPEVRAVLNLGV